MLSRSGLAVGVSLALLAAATTTLVGYYHRQRDERAAEHVARGQALLASGDASGAVVQLQAALTLDRRRPDIELMLASALAALGRFGEADIYLASVLREDPASGPASALRARVLRGLGRDADAVTFYARAVHAVWPHGDLGGRRDARTELATLLLDRGEQTAALGELLELRAHMGDEVEPRMHLARLFLRAGAADEAAVELERVTRDDPRNADAWVLLAQAELGRRRFTPARAAGLRALGLRPGDAATLSLVALAADVLALDPTLRRLSLPQRDTRSRRLLALALQSLDACEPPGTPGSTPEVEELRASARQASETRRSGALADADARVGLAERLWHARIARCPVVVPTDRAVQLVVEAIAAEESGS